MTQTVQSDPSLSVRARVAAQNDAFREMACLGDPPVIPLKGQLLVTRSLTALGEGIVGPAIAAVRAFASFTEDNDPDEIHDFGAVEVQGHRIFWKLDLYEDGTDFQWGAETPDNPETTCRVLTIMLASDW